MTLRAPFPWFGGKSRVAADVWDRFGDVNNYVEPFAGSLAVLLGRPNEPRIETVNDKDCYLANFWRAVSIDAAGVAHYADWPVNEADLHARHLWMHQQTDFRKRMEKDPDYFDARIAGWWVWGLCAWIGDNWCRPKSGSKPRLDRGGVGINRDGIWHKRPQTGKGGHGIHASRVTAGDGSGLDHRRPHLTRSNGVHAKNWTDDGIWKQKPVVSGHGHGIHSTANPGLIQFFGELQGRLRRVRVCCGDWSRVVKPSVTENNGLTGVFLDPPYGVEDRDKVYNHDSLDISADVRKWAIANGNNPKLRIALCGYDGEHDMPKDWDVVSWKANSGYGGQRKSGRNENPTRERIWFSPHCLQPLALFNNLKGSSHGNGNRHRSTRRIQRTKTAQADPAAAQ